MNNNQTSDTTSLREYLGVLSARRGLIIAVVGIATAIGLAYSLVKTPTYEATASVEFLNENEQAGRVIPGAPQFPDIRPDQAAAAAAKTVTSDEVIQRVQKSTDTGLSDDELPAAASRPSFSRTPTWSRSRAPPMTPTNQRRSPTRLRSRRRPRRATSGVRALRRRPPTSAPS